MGCALPWGRTKEWEIIHSGKWGKVAVAVLQMFSWLHLLSVQNCLCVLALVLWRRPGSSHGPPAKSWPIHLQVTHHWLTLPGNETRYSLVLRPWPTDQLSGAIPIKMCIPQRCSVSMTLISMVSCIGIITPRWATLVCKADLRALFR